MPITEHFHIYGYTIKVTSLEMGTDVMLDLNDPKIVLGLIDNGIDLWRALKQLAEDREEIASVLLASENFGFWLRGFEGKELECRLEALINSRYAKSSSINNRRFR